MKKVLMLLLAVAVVMAIIPHARGLGAASMPPGIDAGSWIPLGDAFGFAISKGGSSMGSDTSVGTVKGSFMVRRANTWFSVDPAPEYGNRPVTMAR